MITLGLREVSSGCDGSLSLDLDDIERRFNKTFADLRTVVDRARQPKLVIPTEVIFQATAMLFPPERMLIAPVRVGRGRSTLGPAYDVTDSGPETHRCRVIANPDKLRCALISFDLSGVRLGAWIHSHPGKGPGATTPSSVDRQQYASLAKDFGGELLGMIVVEDRYFRLWGQPVDSGSLRVTFEGDGVHPTGELNVFRLD